jgi:hypothetical protein
MSLLASKPIQTAFAVNNDILRCTARGGRRLTDFVAFEEKELVLRSSGIITTVLHRISDSAQLTRHHTSYHMVQTRKNCDRDLRFMKRPVRCYRLAAEKVG